jgi:RNA polymerase sigma factor (sigma-70 family)
LEAVATENELERLARCYADLVYAAALRQMDGDADRAADVMQAVMLVSLRKGRAGSLPEERFMAGWLLKVTHYAILQARRAAARRARHEAEAAKLSQPDTDQQSTDADVRAALDSAILSLGRLDRELVIRRYLQDQTITEVAAVVSMNPNTAGRRIARAMEKLRKILARHGITAPVTILTTVLSAEVTVRAPTASASTATCQSSSFDLANKVIRKLVIGKMTMAALIASGLSVVVASLVAIALLSTTPSQSPAPPKPVPQPRSLTVEVASVVAGPSDALLHQVLAGLLENQKKLQTIHIAATAITRMYDQQNNVWMAPATTQGQIWAQVAQSKKIRIEVMRAPEPVVQVPPFKSRPEFRDQSYRESWDGKVTYRQFGPPLSQVSGETYNTRSLHAESLLGSDFSMQLPWDEESSADLKGSRKTIDRYPLDPAVLAQMKLSAREILLAGGRDATELDIKTPDEEGEQHNETFWFDAKHGYGLFARLDTISMNGRIVIRTVYLIDDMTQAGPSIFYPVAGEKFLEMQGRPIYWERFDATSVVANEPLSDASFRIDFSRGMPVRDFIDNIGTRRDWNTYQPQP